MSKLIKK